MSKTACGVKSAFAGDKMYAKGYVIFDSVCGGNNIENGANPVLEVSAIAFPEPSRLADAPFKCDAAQKMRGIHILIKPYGRINNMFLERAGTSIYAYHDGMDLGSAAKRLADYIAEQSKSFGIIELIASSYEAESAARFLLGKAGVGGVVIGKRPELNLECGMPNLRGGSLEHKCATYANRVLKHFENKRKGVSKTHH